LSILRRGRRRAGSRAAFLYDSRDDRSGLNRCNTVLGFPIYPLFSVILRFSTYWRSAGSDNSSTKCELQHPCFLDLSGILFPRHILVATRVGKRRLVGRLRTKLKRCSRSSCNSKIARFAPHLINLGPVFDTAPLSFVSVCRSTESYSSTITSSTGSALFHAYLNILPNPTRSAILP
jgi:hypothetical protein